MLASLRTTVLPEFSVEVYPTFEPDRRTHQRYVLVLRDGTAGAIELLFPSARDLRAFLTLTREALAGANQQTRGGYKRFQRPRTKSVQSTLF